MCVRTGVHKERHTSGKEAEFMFAFLLDFDHQSSCSFLQTTLLFKLASCCHDSL